MKALKKVLISIGAIVLIGGLGFFIFLNVASDETKEQLFKDTVFEEVGIDREIYVKCNITSSRKNILGTKWVIDGNLSATSERQNFTSQTITFHFSDGDETYNFSHRLNGAQRLSRPFQVRIKGHQNAQFLSAEVIAAE